MSTGPILLASRSPRRSQLLGLLVPPERIVVQPPASPEEPGFEDCTGIHQVERRLLEIARMKREAVRSVAQCDFAAILAADTTIVAESARGEMAVLGQPPEGPEGRKIVRSWFENYYFVKPHVAMTAVSIETADGRLAEAVVSSIVICRRVPEEQLDWYLDSGESAGRAGGYEIQSRGSMFVDRIEGSLTNIVGLPLEETRRLLMELELISSVRRT